MPLVFFVIYLFFEGYGDHRYLHVLTHSVPTRRSSDLKALLELFGIERREDVTKVIVRGRACSKGTKSLQKIQLFLSKAGDVDECLRTRQNAQQRQKQY